MAENTTIEVVSGQAGRPIEGKEWKDPTPHTWWQKLRHQSLNNRWRVLILWSLFPLYIMISNIYLVHYWSAVFKGNMYWHWWTAHWYRSAFIIRCLFTEGWGMWWKILDANYRAIIPKFYYNDCYRKMAIGFVLFAFVVKFFTFSRVDKEKAAAVTKTKGTSHWANNDEIDEMGLFKSNGVIIGGYKKKGQIHYLRHNGTEHIICVAPSRSGKGVGLVIPTLLDYTGSVFVLDLKAENYIATSGYRRNVMGQHTIRFEPTWTPNKEISAMYEGETAEKPVVDMQDTGRYNPLEEIRMGTPDEVRDIQNVAELLIQSDGGGGGKDPFWDNSAIALLTGAISYELYRKRAEGEDTNPNIGNVRVAMQSGDIKEMFGKWKKAENYDEVFAVRYSDYFYTFNDIKPRYEVLVKEYNEIKAELDKSSKEEQNDEIKTKIDELKEKITKKEEEMSAETQKLGVNKLAFEKANQMLANADDTLSSIVATVNSKLKVWDDPAISANTSHATFHIKDLVNGEKAVSFYLTIYPNDIERLRPLMRILLSQVCSTLAGKMQREADGRIGAGYKHQLLLMLDEFPQLKKMDFLQSGFAYFSGYGIRAYIICQDLEQLEDVYGKNETITSNCHVQIYYAPNKDATARKISEKCGKTTLVIKNTSSSGNPLGFFRTGESVSYHAEETNLLNATQVMNEVHKTANGVAGDSIIFITGHNPIFATQTPYYLDQVIYPRSQRPYPQKNSVTAVVRQRLDLTDAEKVKMQELFTAPMEQKIQREKKEAEEKARLEAKKKENEQRSAIVETQISEPDAIGDEELDTENSSLFTSDINETLDDKQKMIASCYEADNDTPPDEISEDNPNCCDENEETEATADTEKNEEQEQSSEIESDENTNSSDKNNFFGA